MNKRDNGFEYVEGLTSYFKEIQNIRKLTTNEEKALAKKIQHGDKDALNKLVRHNLRFVVSIAKHYRDRGVPFSDLISEGNFGLIQAASKFNPDKNVKFITYAVWWIKHAILEYIDNSIYLINSVEPQDNTMLNELDVDYKTDTINEDFETAINNIQSRKDTIKLITKCLQDREIQVLTLFFGLNDGREMTLEEVGKTMNLTNERVRQIKDCAISKIKCNVLNYSEKDIESFKLLR